MSGVPDVRVRWANDRAVRPDGEYVLYWMIGHRRVRFNFALERAVEYARALGRPLVVLEALHVGYPIKLGGMELNVLLDVFNLLDRQGETSRDMHFNLDQTIDVINYDTGEVNPLLPGGTTCESLGVGSCNPNLNKSNAFQDPRSIRVGLRLTF